MTRSNGARLQRPPDAAWRDDSDSRHVVAAAPDLSIFRRHGGRVAAAAALFPDAPRPWLDLSTGINPHSYPAPRIGRAELARLPDPEDVAALERAAAAAFGADPAKVAATPGTEAALRQLPRLLGARSVRLREPSYGGHRDAWTTIGARIVTGDTAAEAQVVVNPNNPDGRLIAPQDLMTAAQHGWMIVDEAFIDATPQASIAAQAGGRLIVLRSFGKFYGLPALRLGFVVAAPDLAMRVRDAFGEWPLTTPTLKAGLAAYADQAWTGRMRRRLASNARRLDKLLAAAGLEIIGGTDLFRLARAGNADAVFLRLARAGILCRPFDDPHLVRFGLPGTAGDWARLEDALPGDPR
ncbi:threonine-phosphate decarboxylase CobD [Bradyrhizobium sp. WD16]|uniref:threonine-phosphate decarboxylase CobD n=1 Tax=Bradyrhizobium sp. WD16 TaxID=1521768 RepID=UPI0020A2A4FA|nr:threonine-phosphate decarboxylase CobD [Bradyrhizobium sp. WD16]UTD27552.1 threonine-phosphate decarboxylase [Bradyrhizobium sp. WD16]